MNKHIIAFAIFSMAASLMVLTYKNNKLREELLYRHTPYVVNNVMTEEEVKAFSTFDDPAPKDEPIFCTDGSFIVKKIDDKMARITCAGRVVNTAGSPTVENYDSEVSCGDEYNLSAYTLNGYVALLTCTYAGDVVNDDYKGEGK